MSTFRVEVGWRVGGVADIEADSEDDAMKKALNMGTSQFECTGYLDDSFQVFEAMLIK